MSKKYTSYLQKRIRAKVVKIIYFLDFWLISSKFCLFIYFLTVALILCCTFIHISWNELSKYLSVLYSFNEAVWKFKLQDWVLAKKENKKCFHREIRTIFFKDKCSQNDYSQHVKFMAQLYSKSTFIKDYGNKLYFYGRYISFHKLLIGINKREVRSVSYINEKCIWQDQMLQYIYFYGSFHFSCVGFIYRILHARLWRGRRGQNDPHTNIFLSNAL